MRFHHYGFVGRDLATLQRRFAAESSDELTPAIADQTQRVYVQFYRDRITADVWEIIAPLTTVEDSPLAGRIARGGGLDHACYELDATDGTLEDIIAAERALGAKLAVSPIHAAAFGRRIAFVLRRSGRLIEYVEPRRPGQSV